MHNPKFMVLSIDGVPHGLIKHMLDTGIMPNLAKLASKNPLRKMRSVQPTVSCVAWASYATGKNPGKHGLYGFIDKREGTFQLMFPNAATLNAENIWQILSKEGKRVFGMNVPSTYPPRPVNGVLIGGFLSPSIDKAVYPREVADYLKSIDYRIDSDAALARQDKKAMLADLDITLDKRMEAMNHFLDQEDWDFFHTHIMTSDRINHFLLQKVEDNDPEFAPAFFKFYTKVDEYVGKLIDRLPEETPLLLFSDHGFCPIKYEVQLSRFLIETGWTKTADPIQHPLSIDASASRAYCMIPGRVFVNLAGREAGGIVPLDKYQQTREELKTELLGLKDPQTGQKVIDRVLMREEVYWQGDGVCDITPKEVATAKGSFGKAADLILVPHDGYDLKLGLGGTEVFTKTALEGMHTYDDAFMVARNVELPEDNLEIMMLAKCILQKLSVDPPKDMDGTGNAITPIFES